MRSWSALDAATVFWKACIVSMICCMVMFSPPIGATEPYLVLLILLGNFSLLVSGTSFYWAPRYAPNILVGWLARRLTLTTISRPPVSSRVHAFLDQNTLYLQRKRGHRSDHLHSDAQVNNGAENLYVCVIILNIETTYLSRVFNIPYICCN